MPSTARKASGADALAPHGIALVCHGGRSDLGLFKGLFHFLQVLQDTDVSGHLHGGRGRDRQRVHDNGVQKTGIGLSGDSKAPVKAHFLCQHGIEAVDLVEISVKQLKEGGLGACRSLAAEKSEACRGMLDFRQSQFKLQLSLRPHERKADSSSTPSP